MTSATTRFDPPSSVERIFNRVFGVLVGLGLGLGHNYLLQVRGRRSGRLRSTPVNLLRDGERLYLVAPRGRTDWVRNARASGEVRLKKGPTRRRYALRELPDAEKPPLLALYLERFRPTVQRYFPIPAGSPPEAFAALAGSYPVFELEA
ncbi:MAG: nitroreductase family deazaflavin-dependent oxidoreductase [Myxococcota bacterium]